jgi:hypothetical protein
LAEEDREALALAAIFKGLASRYNQLLHIPSTNGPIIE